MVQKKNNQSLVNARCAELARRMHILSRLNSFFNGIRSMPNVMRNGWLPEALKKGMDTEGVADYADKLEKKIKKIAKIHKKAYVEEIDDYCSDDVVDLYVNLDIIYGEIEDQIRKDGPVGRSLYRAVEDVEKYKKYKSVIEERLTYDLELVEKKQAEEIANEEDDEYVDLDDETSMEGCRRVLDKKILED